MRKPSSIKPFLVPVLLLALAMLPALFSGYAREMASGIHGPLAIAAGTMEVAIAGPGLLYRLDHEGNLLKVDDTLIDPGATDAGLAWLGESLLASPAADGGLLLCDEEGCNVFSSDPLAPSTPVQIHVDDGMLWLVETSLDRIHRYRPDGRRIDTPVSDLSQPGDAHREGAVLYVCNTGEARIDTHVIHKTGVAHGELFSKRTSTENGEDPLIHPLRILSRRADSFDVIYTNASGTRGQLARLDVAGNAEPVPSDVLANPVSMARIGEDLLVVDEELMQVVRLKPDGEALLFGDEEFNQRLAADRDERNTWRLIHPLAAVLAALLASIGGCWLLVLLVWPLEKRPIPLHTEGRDPTQWLPQESTLVRARILRNATMLAPAALFPLVALVYLGQHAIAFCWTLIVLAAVVIPPAIRGWLARAPFDTRIGIKGRKLVIADIEHGMREYPIGQVEWSESHLQLPRAGTIPLERKGRPLYHRPTLQAAFLPQLDPSRRLAPPTPKD